MTLPLPSLLTAALVLACALPVQAQYGEVAPVPEAVRAGFEAIDAETCKGWLSVLASDAFEGRGTGTPGYQKAAEFVAAHFQKLGLKPVGDGDTYFQYVPFARIQPDADASVLKVKGKGMSRTFRAKDGIAFAVAHGDVTGPILVLNAGGNEAVLPDPAILDGKIVLVKLRRSLRAPIRAQLNDAKPLAMFEILNRVPREAAGDASTLAMATDLRLGGRMTEECAQAVLKTVGLDPKALDDGADGVLVQETQNEATVRHAGKRADVLVPNVVGLLEGSDPALAHEVVILGSHLDHIGKDGSSINNGADDDGSGTTALMAIASAMTQNPTKPRRSVLFLAVCGEEMGLLGSRYYVENPIFPLVDTVCELQMDMIGRNEETQRDRPQDNVDTTHLVGSKRLSQELHDVILAQNAHIGFTFEYDQEDVYTRSDHYNFAKMGIPIAFVFSGFHPDYHKPTDTIEKINFEKIVSTARLFYLVAHTVADMPRRLIVDDGPMKTAKAGESR